MTYHDSCHLLRGLGESRSAARAAARACAGVRARRAAGRGRVLRLRRLLLGAAARGVHRHPRQEARQRGGAPAPTAWWPATRAASCRWAAGSRGAAPRVRAVHLAQVLAGEATRERRAARGRRFPSGPARRSRTRFLQEALTIATTKFIDLRRRPSRASRRARRCATGRARIKEATLQQLDHHLERLADNVERLGGHVHWAATAEEAREIVLRLCRDRGVRMAVKSQVDGHRGDRPQRGARGTRGSRRSRPTSASTSSSSPTRSRRTSSRPPSTRRRGRWPSSSRGSSSGQLRRRSRGADRGGAEGAAREVPPGRHGHHRRQLRGGRDGHRGARDQRGQRPDGDLAAADPRGA